MFAKKDDNDKKAEKEQDSTKTKLVTTGVVVVVCFGLWGLFSYFFGHHQKAENTNVNKAFGNFDTVFNSDYVNKNNTTAITKNQSNIADVNAKVGNVYSEVQDLKTNKTNQSNEIQQLKSQIQDMSDKFNRTLDKLSELQKAQQHKTYHNPNNNGSNDNLNAFGNTDKGANKGTGMPDQSIQQNTTNIMTTFNFDYTDKDALYQIEKNKYYVTTPSYSTGILMSGADASASVMAQNDTTPITIKLRGMLHMAGNQTVDANNCVILAGVYGDVSAETGEVRLKHLSCRFPDGRIVDTDVQGYVVGERGKEGMRGKVVMRNGKLLFYSGFSGLFEGLGSSLSQYSQNYSVTPFGGEYTTDPSSIPAMAAGMGVEKAFSKLSDYYMKRADQYHPIVEVPAGSRVDVVFTNSFWLDGKDHIETQDKHAEEDVAHVKAVTKQAKDLAENQGGLSKEVLNRIKQMNPALGAQMGAGDKVQ